MNHDIEKIIAIALVNNLFKRAYVGVDWSRRLFYIKVSPFTLP